MTNRLPGTEPQMLSDGTWIQFGLCRQCGHTVFFHKLWPRWACQNADCKCPPPPLGRPKK